jgi:DNA-directed RNA polymerase specialized sigma24 family protein
VSNEVVLAEAASGQDPAAGLRAARALRELAERLETLQVRNAREHGWSWQEIAVFLGVSKQAVHKRYAGLLDGLTTQPGSGRGRSRARRGGGNV